MFENFDFTNFWEDSVYALEEYNYEIIPLANSFKDFIRGLTKENDFEIHTT